MQILRPGEHFGVNDKRLLLNDCILTEADNSPRGIIPWHYHENAYLFYQLKGHLVEVNKKKSFTCFPGTVLFHYWQEPHYNSNFSDDSRFFHIEVGKKWFDKHMLNSCLLEGSNHLENSLFKSLVSKIYHESKINDAVTPVAIEGLLLQIFATMIRYPDDSSFAVPKWVQQVRDIIHDQYGEKITLSLLSEKTGMHPVHLSRDFPKYFHTSFGDYIRKIKLERSAFLLSAADTNITSIAYQCGFADQSHFIRSFKKLYGMTPMQYRKEHGAR